MKEYIQSEHEKHEKELIDMSEAKEKQFIGAVGEVLDKHQRELTELKECYEKELADRDKEKDDGREANSELGKRLDAIQADEERELSALKEQLVEEAKAKIAQVQDSLLRQITDAEQANLLLRQKLSKTDEDLSGVTQERDRLLREMQVMTETRKLLQHDKGPGGLGLSPVHQEEPILMQQNADQLETLPSSDESGGKSV